MSRIRNLAARRGIRVGAIAAAAAVVLGGIALGGGDAGADLVAWTDITTHAPDSGDPTNTAKSAPGTFGVNFQDADAGHANPGFKVDDDGVVHLRGLTGAMDAPTQYFGAYAVHVLTLPCEARPATELSMPAIVAGASADPQPVILRVFPTGSVDLFVGPTGAAITEVSSEMVFGDYLSLDGFEWEWDSLLTC